MRVQITGRTGSGVPIDWAVLDDDDCLVPEVNRYLSYLRALERPPNTIRATAYDLRYYSEFLASRGLGWDAASDDVLASFARWYRSPDENVIAIVDAEAARARSSANRALASVSGLYRYLGSFGRGAPGAAAFQRLERSAAAYRRPRVTTIDNVGNASRYREMKRLGPRLPRRKRRLKVLTVQQVHLLLSACRDRRERLILMLAFTTGMRIGQILGLRHEDIDTRGRCVRIEVRDDNPNGARPKTSRRAEIPMTEQVNRLYIEYMHEEYGYVDSPFVFIDFDTLEPLAYPAVSAVVARLRRRTGINDWSLHTLRHTFVTLSRRAGIPIEVVSALVTHASIQTTISMYSHLDVDDLRRVLIEHGAWDAA